MTDILRLATNLDLKTYPTINHLSRNDLVCIWARVSSYIERHMTSLKGVHLAGLGTFTFSQQRLDIGHTFTMLQKPIFLPSAALVQSLALNRDRPLAVSTHLPVVQVNFSAVSQETGFSRDVVDRCVRETLLLLVRSLLRGDRVSLVLQGLGVLTFRQNKVQMKFNSVFLEDGRHRGNQAKTTDQLVLPFLHDSSNVLPDTNKTPLEPSQSDQTMQAIDDSHTGASTPTSPPESTDRSLQIRVSPQEGSISTFFASPTQARAEQDLCVLCLQRSSRNVPVYVGEQKLAEEKHQEKVLMLKAQQEAKRHLEKEQMKLRERRLQAQKNAAINLQMSEKGKTCSSLDMASFLLLTRPITPPRRPRQQQYLSELQRQVESRRRREAEEQHECRLAQSEDRLHQEQQISSMKSQQLQRRVEKQRSYKSALDLQVGDKKTCSHVEIHPQEYRNNRCETPVVNAERRGVAQQLFRMNSSAATQRKKGEVQGHHTQLEKEKQMLEQNKKEFILDHVTNSERRKEIRKALEDEWRRSAGKKHQREEEEKTFLRSASQSLVEKLIQHKRCSQCKRRTSNCGESNIWRDSSFTSGSQFMI